MAAVLVIDDREANRCVISSALRAVGHVVAEAADCAQARIVLHAAPLPDIAIIDIHLPDGLGVDLCREIKADPATRAILVLTTSAVFTSTGDRADSLDAGADGVLVQPFEPREIVARVNALLRLREMEVLRAAAESRERAAMLALEERTRELERLNADLEQFAFVASHDLQAPLRHTASFLDLLRQRHGAELSRPALQLVERAADGAQRMQALVRSLLAFARTGRQAPDEETAADDALREALDNLAQSVAETGARVEAEPLPLVRCARVQLVQVFQNLVGNALVHRGDAPPRIRIWAETGDEGGNATIRVRDHGPGLDVEACRPFLFTPFWRGSCGAGSGLGLATCQRIITARGGRIWVDSAPGAGATFSFTLPCLARCPQPVG